MPMPMYHISYDFIRQFNILFQYADLVVQPVNVQVMPVKQKTYFLNILLQVEFRQQFPQFSLSDAAVYRASRIYDLLRLERETVAEMRHIHRHRVAEIPVPQPSVAQIAGGKGDVHESRQIFPGPDNVFFRTSAVISQQGGRQ